MYTYSIQKKTAAYRPKLTAVFAHGWMSFPFLCSLHTFKDRTHFSQMSVITTSTFDISKLSVGDPKKLDYSSTVYLNYDGNKRVRIQGPRMALPFDLKDYEGNKKFKVQFNLKDHESNPKMKAYFDMLQQIDEFVISKAVANADKWLNKKGKSREVIEEGYTRSIKLPKDSSKNYPPSQAVTVKHDGKHVNGVQQMGKFLVELYDSENQPIEDSPLNHLKRGAMVTPILEAAGIWIAGKGNFGITWKLHQARVDVPGENARSGCAILDDDEGGVVVSATNGVSAAEEDAELLAAVLPKDEEDEDDGVEDDEVVEPVPVPLKKAAAATPAAAPAARKVVKKVTKA